MCKMDLIMISIIKKKTTTFKSKQIWDIWRSYLSFGRSSEINNFVSVIKMVYYLFRNLRHHSSNRANASPIRE